MSVLYKGNRDRQCEGMVVLLKLDVKRKDSAGYPVRGQRFPAAKIGKKPPNRRPPQPAM
jgi:hypothetical protein